MTTYQMSEQDKAASFRKLCDRLFFGGHTLTIDASNEELCTALRTIPNIDQIDVLWRTVGADGVWAAQQVQTHA